MAEKYKPMWEIRQSADPAVLDMYVYGDVEASGYDWWTDKYVDSEASAEHFRAELAAHPDVTTIRIYINSWGGSVFEGTAIYNQLRRHPAEKIVYIDGFACSIASVIAMAGNRVIMPRNTLMMIHNMCWGVFGNAAELRKAADDLEVINAAGRQAYLTKAGDKLDKARLTEMMDAETWLTAEECIALGLADEYAEADADMSAAEMMQKATQTLESKIAMHRALAAQLRELVEPQTETEAQTETEPQTEPEQQTETEPEPEGKQGEPEGDTPAVKTNIMELLTLAVGREGNR